MAKSSTVRRPTEDAAIGRTADTPTALPVALLLDRIALTRRCRDRYGFRALVQLLARVTGEAVAE